MIKKRFLSMLVLLCLTVSGAWAQNPSWVRAYDTWDEATKTLTVNTDPWDNYAGNEAIEHVIIGNRVTEIGEAAFKNCSNLTSVSIPSNVTTIGKAAFESTNLTSVSIPSNVTRIGEAVFKNCSNLTSVSIPNSVTSIDYEAFANCSKLTSVSIPSSVTNIGSSAFESTGLTSVTIPGNEENGTTIGNAFYQCGNLTTVTLGNGGGSIDGGFDECGSLTKVIVYAESAGTWKATTNMFGNSYNNRLKIYVPSNLVDEFKNDDDYYWVLYKDIIVAITTSDVSLKEGTEDASNWQGKAGEGEYQALPLEGVAVGKAVSVKYSGWKLVKSVNAKKKATAEDKGKVIGTDGKIYDTKDEAEDAGTTAVAKIIYIGPTGHATYRNGLALALTDEGWMNWWDAGDHCSEKNRSTPVTGATWLLATKDDWNNMITAAGGYEALRDGFSSVGGSNLQSDHQGLYWSSTGHDGWDSDYEKWCYVFGDGHWGYNAQANNCWARACLAFGALETVTQNHSANNTWAIAEMPDADVDLEVEYFNITVPTANTADIYAGWTTPLINAGSTKERGATMKYLVTATNEQPTSTDGFSAAVPTAQGRTAGTYYVWYYLDFESGDDSDISALAVEVTVSVHVTMKEGTFDADNWQGKAGTGEYQALPLEDLEPGTALSVKYNGTKKVKSVKAKGKPLSSATAEAKGKLIGADGNIYDTKDEAEDAGITAVAKIIYIGPTGHATYNHGLALALTDEGGG